MENKDVIYADVEELTSDVMEAVSSDKTVGIICHYELATEILKDLMRYENIIINNIEINNPEWDGYEDEYLVSVDNGELFCEKMKHDDRYILYIADVAFVHQDCNSALIAKNDVKDAAIKFFEYEWELEDDDTEETFKMILADKSEVLIEDSTASGTVTMRFETKESMIEMWSNLTDDKLYEIQIMKGDTLIQTLHDVHIVGVQNIVNPEGTLTTHFYME